VLKFRNNSFRGVDKLDCPSTKSSKVGSFWAPNICGVDDPKYFTAVDRLYIDVSVETAEQHEV